MRLTDLEPQFVAYAPGSYAHVERIEQADGITFVCPGCLAKSADGRAGVHSVLAWFRGRGVPDDETPGPGRWAASGTGYADLTLAPSIDVGCWHGFVRNGEIT